MDRQRPREFLRCRLICGELGRYGSSYCVPYRVDGCGLPTIVWLGIRVRSDRHGCSRGSDHIHADIGLVEVVMPRIRSWSGGHGSGCWASHESSLGLATMGPAVLVCPWICLWSGPCRYGHYRYFESIRCRLGHCRSCGSV